MITEETRMVTIHVQIEKIEIAVTTEIITKGKIVEKETNVIEMDEIAIIMEIVEQMIEIEMIKTAIVKEIMNLYLEEIETDKENTNTIEIGGMKKVQKKEETTGDAKGVDHVSETVLQVEAVEVMAGVTEMKVMNGDMILYFIDHHLEHKEEKMRKEAHLATIVKIVLLRNLKKALRKMKSLLLSLAKNSIVLKSKFVKFGSEIFQNQ